MNVPPSVDDAPPGAGGARRLLSGAFILFCARLVSMGLGLLQAILLATKFGTSSSADAYFVAYALCFLFVAPTEGGLMMAFVPVFMHTAEKEGEDQAWRIAAGLCRVGLIGIGAVALVLILGSTWIAPLLAPGFDPAAVQLVARFLRVLAPIIVLMFVAAFLSTTDYIAGRFLMPGLGMAVHAAAGPFALWAFADRFGAISVAWGIVIGGAIRCAMLLLTAPESRRLLGPAVPFRHPAMKEIGRTISARVITSWFIDLNLMVDRVFASFLGPGFVSVLAYASRAVTAIVNAVVMPMGRALMPTLSRLAAQRHDERLRGVIEKVVIAIGFLIVPLVAFMTSFRVEILTVLFRRGQFGATSVDQTAYALLFFSLGIVPFLITPVLNGTFFAMGESATPLKIGVVCVLANAALDWVLMLWLGHGGIALSTSVVGAIRAFLLWVYLQRRLGRLRSGPVLGSLLVSVAGASAAFWGAQALVSLGGPEWSSPLWRLGSYAVVGSAAYLLLQGALNRPLVKLVPWVMGRRLRPRAS